MRQWLNKISVKIIAVPLLAMFLSTTVFVSCTKEEVVEFLTDLLVETLASWNVDEENLAEIPQDLDINEASGELPASVDLQAKFPPIGDQGEYGTCVTWAVGYNLKTALNGIDNQWNASQLSQATNITSPKDLFWAIPAFDKGSDCNGTQFEAAMDQLIARGGASMSTVPYTNLGDCSQTPPSSWTEEAADNKLLNYRKIADVNNRASMTLENFKAYLAEGRPVAIGAKLGDRFMRWSSDAVIDYDTYQNPGMQHAYHAMALCGYSDAKAAFKVINTWGSSWGDNGIVWVDYDFFLQNFCFAAFVAQNKSHVDVSDNEIGPGDIATGLDVLAWNLKDFDNPESQQPLDRQISFNVFNSGTQTVRASSGWSILYMYYNAYDANDYDILIHDYYTDEFSTVPGDNDFWADGYGISGSWWNYIDVPSGKSVAAALYDDSDADFWFTYTMPNTLNGKYFLVLFADGFNDLAEVNEDNNFFFYSKDNGKPFNFVNGVIQDDKEAKKMSHKKAPGLFADTDFQSVVNKANVNAYSSDEIRKLVLHQRSNGELQRKALQYKINNRAKQQLKTKAKY
ncbi:MAG: C1 family peptidase [Bacteroidales bacterium]|jgi:C1A family cysteine protease|nr:C1 family peptidase [Bacteroidales bacterium]